jgi:hypothetical protein
MITRAYEGDRTVWGGWSDPFDLAADQEERDALYRIWVHTEKYASLDGSVVQLAHHHRDWLRPVEQWFPQSPNKRRQFAELARHLLARYDVPLFMDAAWREPDGPDARKQQTWFKHMGMGGSIRTMDSDIALTRRMAHLFTQTPSHYSVPMGLRRAQFLAMGGSPGMAEAVVRSRLRYFMEDEPFWATVVLFLANHPLLDPACVGPIVDYIYNQRFVGRLIPGPDGQVIRGEPLQPNMTMKGRSLDKLLRQVDEWHEELGIEEDEEWIEWPGSGIRAYSTEEEDERLGTTVRWSVVELCDSRALAQEGQAMHHCVRTYAPRCASGIISVWSLQAALGEGESQPVLTIAVNNRMKLITEYRGKHNLRPEDRPRNPKQQRIEGRYLHLLRQSPRIMGQWMEREELQR